MNCKMKWELIVPDARVVMMMVVVMVEELVVVVVLRGRGTS